MKRIALLLFLSLPVFAASPATCYPASGVTNMTNWNLAANWSSSAGGSGSTCGATGGTSVSYRGATVTLAAGVPGASGSKDRVVLPSSGSGIFHFSVNVELGDPSSSATVAALIIGSTSTPIIDDGVLLSLRGYGTVGSGTGGIGANNSVVEQMPGSGVWWDTAGVAPNNGEWQTNARWHVGCGDLIKAPTGQCTENAGASESVSAASPGVWTAGLGTTQPTGWHVGDLVEINPIPQAVTTGTGAVGPPYAPFPCVRQYDSIVNATLVVSCTPPADFSAPPNYPITTDSATCNTLASCPVPIGIPLCIVSASPLELGWPTSLALSCAGSVAMNISNAGTGWMWMHKPAFFWGLPSNLSWSTAQSLSSASPTASFDAIESTFDMYAPISNAAGTGPGRKGDNSFSVSAISVAPTTGTTYTSLLVEKDRPWDLTKNGDFYINYSLGQMFLYGGYVIPTISATWKTLSNNPLRTPHFTFPGTCTTNREFLMENADVQFLFSNASGSVLPFDIHDFCTTSATASIRWEHTTMRNNGRMFAMANNVGTALKPITFNSNAHYNSSTGNPGTNQDAQAVWATFNGGNNFIDYSNNYLENHYGQIYCSGTNNQTLTNTNLTITNNVGYYIRLLWCQGNGHNNKSPDLLLQRNRATTDGSFDAATEPGFESVTVDSYMGTPNHPAIYEWNHTYGQLRGHFFDSYSDTRYNYDAWFRHHGAIPQAGENHLVGAAYHHNIGGEKGHDDGCVASGYDGIQLIDQLYIYNITCTGTIYSGLTIGDQGDASNILATGLVTMDSVVQTDTASPIGSIPVGAITLTQNNNGNAFTQYGCMMCGWNTLYGSGLPYAGAHGTVPPNMVDPTLHRFTNPKQAGVPYNTSSAKNIGGSALQNPTYTGNTVVAGILQWLYTNGTNITVSWDDGLGTGAGAAQQISWGGSGVSYIPLGVSETDDQQIAYITMPVSWGTQTDYQTGCPDATWAKITTGTAIGKVYAVIRCGGTGNSVVPSPVPSNLIALIPDPVLDGYASGDHFVIYQSTIVLPNGNGSQTVTLAIDPRSTPTTTQTDTGISLNLVDYCASGCSGTLNPAIPGGTQNDVNSFLWGTATGSGGVAGTNAPVNCSIAEPMRGGNIVTAFAAGSCYIPTGSAWLTAGHNGGKIGAAGTLTDPVTPTFFLP